MSKNSITIDGNKVYFDDLVLEKDESDIRFFPLYNKKYIEDVITHDRILETDEVIDRLTIGSDFVHGEISSTTSHGGGILANSTEDQLKHYRFEYKNPD